ncbi:EscJ/YscJ/HrcJ family type III secretion inner membrane ring protein, partial [Paraburkholderia sp. SIMBA_049]
MKSNLVPSRPRASWRLVAAAVLVLSLAACKQELYGQLSESDCNEMVAALLSSGVDAQKSTPDGGKTWSVGVDGKQIVNAV